MDVYKESCLPYQDKIDLLIEGLTRLNYFKYLLDELQDTTKTVRKSLLVVDVENNELVNLKDVINFFI